MEHYCLDEMDYAILKVLQADSRITYNEMGRKLHKSISPLLKRIKRMERLGYIQSYVTLLDYSKIRSVLMSYISVNLTDHTIEARETFSAEVAAMPEVMECVHLAGHTDFLLKVAARNMDDYNEFLFRKLGKLSTVASFKSSIVLGQSKNCPIIPF
ncbi:Lrp/AsnC family transcriptional regulator [Pedobacter aquatilis]|uniref:Lrp/AsnC family transcriptional regulator n=1 Tax=Pedobacter aquatilis TaxID=351343 RepID=UPI00292CCEC5|nr:Lrp/AsnC family transcriptional regulator [Pedobacter aquatilis]